MTKKYTQMTDGSVFYPLSKRAAMMLWENNVRESLDICLNDEQGNSMEPTELADIENWDGPIGLYLGNVQDIVSDRRKLFPTLESIVDYVSEHGKLPFGLRSIASYNGWEACNAPGIVGYEYKGKVFNFDIKTSVATIL